MKTCTKCGAEKPLLEFNKSKSSKDGLSYQCKLCAKTSASNWYEDNKESAKHIRKKYYDENIDKIKEYQKIWRAKNKEILDVKKTEWRKNNLEKQRQSSKKYRENNKEKMASIRIAYVENNPEKVKQSKEKYAIKNKEIIKQKAKQRRLKNPEKHKKAKHNRRAREKNALGFLSEGLVFKLCNLQRGMCACCKKPLGNNYHMDHIIPLARGGTNTDDNIQLLRARCNLQKNAKDPIDFMQERGYLL